MAALNRLYVTLTRLLKEEPCGRRQKTIMNGLINILVSQTDENTFLTIKTR